MTQTVNMLDFRRNIGRIVDRVYYQKQKYLIRRKDQVMAALIPIEDYNLYLKDADADKIEDYTQERIKEFRKNDQLSPRLKKKLKQILKGRNTKIL